MSAVGALPYIQDFEVDSSGQYATSSDHATLKIRLNIPMKNIQCETKTILKIRNIKHFKKSIKEKLNHQIDIKYLTVNQMADQFQKILFTSASQYSSSGKNRRVIEGKKTKRLRKKSLQLAKNIKAAYRQGQIVRFTTLRDEYEKVKKEQLKHENKRNQEKLKNIQRLIKKGGKRGRKLFWKSINSKTKGSKFIQALEENGKLITSPEEKARIIEAHFEKKFKTSAIRKKMEEAAIEDWMERDKNEMNEEDREFLESDITMEELHEAVKKLDESKACGLDEITPEMLKNMGSEMEARLLQIFNTGNS